MGNKKKNKKPIDLWLGSVGIAAGLGAIFIPKTLAAIIICLIIMFALLVHPFWNFWWIEKKLGRQIASCAFLIILLAAFGHYIWPEENITIQAPPKEIPKESEKVPRTNRGKDKDAPRNKASELNKDYPIPFEIKAPVIATIADSSKYFDMKITITNLGNALAHDFALKLIVIDQKFQQCQPATVIFSSANPILPKNPIIYHNDKFYDFANDLPMYIICIIKYHDISFETNRKIYSQFSYFKWDGLQHGVISPNIYYASTEEGENIRLRLKSEIEDFLK